MTNCNSEAKASELVPSFRPNKSRTSLIDSNSTINKWVPASATGSQDEVHYMYDYIVIGAGSAGSIVAAKLAASDSAMNVLLIEAGGFPISDQMYSPSNWFEVLQKYPEIS